MKEIVEHLNDWTWWWRGFVGTLFVVLSTLVGIVWKSLRKEAGEFREWKKGMDGQKGVLSRKEFEDGCIRNQTRCSESVTCRICEIEDWKEELMKGGGPLVLKDHFAGCEKIGEKFASSIEKTMESHREWVLGKFTNLQVTIQNDVLREIINLKDEIKKSNGHT